MHCMLVYLKQYIQEYRNRVWPSPWGMRGLVASLLTRWYDGIRARIIRSRHIRVVCPKLGMDKVVRTEAVVRFCFCILDIQL